MKKLILILALFLGLSLGAKAQNFVGWDGDCTVYFQPGYGYYEYCDGVPDFLGYSWGSWGWRYGWHRNWNGGNWNGGPRRGWNQQWHGNRWNQSNWRGHTWNPGNRGTGMNRGGPRGHPQGGHPHGMHPHGH